MTNNLQFHKYKMIKKRNKIKITIGATKSGTVEKTKQATERQQQERRS